MGKKEYLLNLSCPDQIGIVAAVTGALAEQNLFILDLSQYSDPSTKTFFMRIHFQTTYDLPEASIIAHLSPMAQRFEMDWALHDTQVRPNVFVMVSKQSHCLNDLLHQWSIGTLPIHIKGVISNHETLQKMASWYEVPFHYLPVTLETKRAQEEVLLDLVNKEHITLIILARYMQILSESFCQKMPGQIINIHHSFLPSFKGAKPYHQAFERGVKMIGATAHYVTADLDEGPIIEQGTTRVRHDQGAEELVRIGRDIEARVLARAVKYHAEHRVILSGNKTIIFN